MEKKYIKKKKKRKIRQCTQELESAIDPDGYEGEIWSGQTAGDSVVRGGGGLCCWERLNNGQEVFAKPDPILTNLTGGMCVERFVRDGGSTSVAKKKLSEFR